MNVNRETGYVLSVRLTCVGRRLGRVLRHVYALGCEMQSRVDLYLNISYQLLYVLPCCIVIAVIMSDGVDDDVEHS